MNMSSDFTNNPLLSVTQTDLLNIQFGSDVDPLPKANEFECVISDLNIMSIDEIDKEFDHIKPQNVNENNENYR